MGRETGAGLALLPGLAPSVLILSWSLRFLICEVGISHPPHAVTDRTTLGNHTVALVTRAPV